MPPVNLKDRIAALQQRNASTAGHGSESTTGRLPGASSLKDKIANFERKGAVPIPKGRFGTSAPVATDGSTKRRGELYGNRVPELAKPSPDAVLPLRKRAVSTSDALHSRPASPDVPPVPHLPGEPLQCDVLESHLLPFDKPAARRVVSDVLPRKNPTFEPEPLVREVEDAVTAGGSEAAMETISEAVIYAEVSPTITDTPLETSPTLTRADEAEPSSVVVLSGGVDDEDVSEPETIKMVDAAPSDTPSEPIPITPVSAAEETAAPEPPMIGDLEVSSPTVPSIHDVAVLVENLTVNTEADSSSLLEDSTASSESQLTTPSDNLSFAMAESPIGTQGNLAKAVSTPSSPIVVSPQDAAPSSPAVTPSTLRNSASVRQSVLSEMSVGGESLVLDVKEAIIVTEPPHIVSPTITRATLVPAPTPTPTPSASLPNTVSATEQALLERRATQKSFHAVVHRKVRETTSAEPVNPLPVPPKEAPNLSTPRASATRRIRVEGSTEPQSPGFTDLLSLVADAALLEEQLASSRSPSKSSIPTPTLNVHPTVPKIPESGATTSTVTQSPRHLQPESSPSSNSSHSYQLPAVHVRSRTTSEHPTTPPREGGRYFSSLRVRKKSMPGAYPRTSVCSEMSTDSSMLVSRPVTPTSYGQDSLNSDASSVRSSTKSWKSPKKGISRAGSWLFRGKSKNHIVVEGMSRNPDFIASKFIDYGIRAGCASGCF